MAMVDDLLSFVQKASEGLVPKIEEDLGSGFVRLHVSEAEKRQARQDIRCVEDAVREALRNSRDAGAKSILVAMSKIDPSFRKITVIDDGSGIPEKFHKSIFESRITSRLSTINEDAYGVHGRGMALFSISQRAKSYEVINSVAGAGSVIEIVFDLFEIKERSDQSSTPRVIVSGGKRKLGRGPHNVKRVLMQFALDHPELLIYLGSPSEVLSTLVAFSTERESRPPLFTDGNRELSVWKSGIHLSSPRDLMKFAEEKAGLETSLRNCQRIISGELPPLIPLISANVQSGKKAVAPRLSRLFKSEPLAARISDADVDELREKSGRLVSQIGQKYFLEILGKPLVRRSGDSIQLTFNLIDSDEKNGL